MLTLRLKVSAAARALCAGAGLALIALTPAAAQVATPLPVPAGEVTVVAANNARTVAGYVADDAGAAAASRWKPLLWTQKNGTFSYEYLPLGPYDRGLVRGLSETGAAFGSVYTGPGDFSPAVWEGGALKVLPSPIGRGEVLGANSKGSYAGYVDFADKAGEAAVWENGVLRTLPAFGAGAEARAIDEDGTIYGRAVLPDNSQDVPVAWSNGEIRILPIDAPRGPESYLSLWDARSGRLAGSIQRIEPTGERLSDPVVWENGQYRVLEEPAGPVDSVPTGVNALGQFAGYVWDETAGNRAVIWTAEGLSVLASGAKAVDINDNGFVIGQQDDAGPVYWDLSAVPSIAMADVAAAAGANVTLRATATRAGAPASNAQVTFTAGGQDVGVATTNAKGVASLSYRAPRAPGVQAVTAGVPGSPVAARSVIVGKSPAVAGVTSAVGKIGQRVTVSANLALREQNAPLKGKTVSFLVNGKTVARATTDAKGVARATLVIGPSPAGSSYSTLDVSYAGDGSSSAAVGRGVIYPLPQAPRR